MIAVEGLTARSGGFTLRADLRVAAGEICALVGPSGGGKSTLLAAIAGFAPVAAGAVAIDGSSMAGLAPADRPVTLLFQENNLFPHLTLAENVGLGLRPALRLSPPERARVAAALAEAGLAGLEDRRPDSLSGGQRQRAALARALLRERPALLLDEPFAALGPGQRADMLDFVARAMRPRRAAVLMVTHQPEDARKADTVAFCADGRIAGARPAEAAFRDPTPEMAAYLGRG